MSPVSTRQVLIVEDDYETLDVVSHTLRREGFDVGTFTEARAALEAARRGAPPALILLDYVMGDMSADAFVRELRREGVRTEVVLMTGMTPTKISKEVLRAVRLIRKPLDMARLVDLVTRGVARSHEQPALSSAGAPSASGVWGVPTGSRSASVIS